MSITNLSKDNLFSVSLVTKEGKECVIKKTLTFKDFTAMVKVSEKSEAGIDTVDTAYDILTHENTLYNDAQYNALPKVIEDIFTTEQILEVCKLLIESITDIKK